MPPILSIVTVSSEDLERFEQTRASLQKLDADFEHIVVVPIEQSSQYLDLIKVLPSGNGMSTRLISDAGVGIYEAMNVGASEAHGRFITFWNSGDRLLPGFAVNELANSLKATDAEWVLFGAELGWGQSYNVTPKQLNRFVKFRGGFISHQAIAVRVDRFKNLGGFNTNYRVASDTQQIIELTRTSKYDIYPKNVVFVETPNFAAKNSKKARKEIVVMTFRGNTGFLRLRLLWNYCLLEVENWVKSLNG